MRCTVSVSWATLAPRARTDSTRRLPCCVEGIQRVVSSMAVRSRMAFVVSATHFGSRVLSAPEQAHSMSILSAHSFLSGPHGRRAPCHEDCGPAATQQGTSVLTEESACSNCSLLLNCTCTRLSSMKAQSMLFAREAECHAATTDWTSVGDKGPQANAFAYSARSLLCSSNRGGWNTRQWAGGSCTGAEREEGAAAAELAAETAALEAGAAAAACSAAAAANSCCCAAGNMDARPGCRAPLTRLAGATDEDAQARPDGRDTAGTVTNASRTVNWATRDECI